MHFFYDLSDTQNYVSYFKLEYFFTNIHDNFGDNSSIFGYSQRKITFNDR